MKIPGIILILLGTYLLYESVRHFKIDETLEGSVVLFFALAEIALGVFLYRKEVFELKDRPRVDERVKVIAVSSGGIFRPHEAVLEAQLEYPGENHLRLFYVPLKKLPNGLQTTKEEELIWTYPGVWKPYNSLAAV